MTPAASVSGIYLGHPEVRYFSVGRVGRDQVEDYAARKGMPLDEVERWLRRTSRYEPGDDPIRRGGLALRLDASAVDRLRPRALLAALGRGGRRRRSARAPQSAAHGRRHEASRSRSSCAVRPRGRAGSSRSLRRSTDPPCTSQPDESSFVQTAKVDPSFTYQGRRHELGSEVDVFRSARGGPHGLAAPRRPRLRRNLPRSRARRPASGRRATVRLASIAGPLAERRTDATSARASSYRVRLRRFARIGKRRARHRRLWRSAAGRVPVVALRA